MKYLNLTKGFNPFNADLEDSIKFESFYFSGGEPHIKIISNFDNLTDVIVTCRLNNMNDVGMLMVATEALRQTGWLSNSFLFIPYFPGARQDRRMIVGEPLTVKIYADIINSLGFDEVNIFDPHSDVAPALVDNSITTTNHKFVQVCLEDITITNGGSTLDNYVYYNLISPDAGSNKKIYKLSQYLSKVTESYHSQLRLTDEGLFGGEDKIIKCDKTRDVKTGALSGFEVYSDDLQGRDCIICDDICDGGGTFIGLAKELKKKNAGDLYLIVSHGIFSKGLKELSKYFKQIYTTDSWRSEFSLEQQSRDNTELVKIIKLNTIL